MIDLHYWTTPNGHKITIAGIRLFGAIARNSGLNCSPWEMFTGTIRQGSPSSSSAIVDHDPAEGGAPLSIFESGAILEYLADKTGKLLPRSPRERFGVLQWLYWQMGGLGPMAGQNHHFSIYAPERIPYATERYVKETGRLYGVLDRQLAGRDFVAGDFSIADIAIYPWIVPYERQKQRLEDFPNVARWFAAMAARPSVIRAYEIAARINTAPTVTEESKRHLFGQSAATVQGRA